MSPLGSVGPDQYTFFRYYLEPLERELESALRSFLDSAFVRSNLIRGEMVNRLLDIKVKLTPRDGDECTQLYGWGSELPVCSGVYGWYDLGNGVVELFIGSRGLFKGLNLAYTVAHLLVHHLQVTTKDLTLFNLDGEAVREAMKLRAVPPWEVEAYYLGNLFLDLSTLTVLDPDKYSCVWRHVTRIALYSRPDSDPKRDAARQFNIFRTLFISRILEWTRRLEPIAGLATQNGNFTVRLRNVLEVDTIDTLFSALYVSGDYVCLEEERDDLEVCYVNFSTARSTKISVKLVFPEPTRLELSKLTSLTVSFNPPRASVTLSYGGESVNTEASIEIPGAPMWGEQKTAKKTIDDVVNILARVKSLIKLPEPVCGFEKLEIPVPVPLVDPELYPGVDASVPIYDLARIHVPATYEVCSELVLSFRPERGE